MYMREGALVIPNSKQAIRQIAFRQIAWSYCLGQSLRKLDATERIEEYLNNDDVSFVKKHKNIPLAISCGIFMLANSAMHKGSFIHPFSLDAVLSLS